MTYSQTQTEDRSSIVKVVDHFVVCCVVHLHVPERQTRDMHYINFPFMNALGTQNKTKHMIYTCTIN